MTRQEAAAILKDNLYGFVGDDITEALYLAVEALEGPAPDPDTGLMPCRCGGKAGFHYSVMLRDNDCYVACGICGEHSKVALCEEKARDAWNAALRGPQPDPDTGLMKCGCGSPAVVLYNEKLKCLYVQCTRCDTRSNFFNHRENAVFMWNRAMGKQEETL